MAMEKMEVSASGMMNCASVLLLPFRLADSGSKIPPITSTNTTIHQPTQLAEGMNELPNDAIEQALALLLGSLPPPDESVSESL
ncbi:hypothetical protein FRC03_007712, partial [Tulasnella sp. 419]